MKRYQREVSNHHSSCKPLFLTDLLVPLYSASMSYKELFDMMANMVNDLASTIYPTTTQEAQSKLSWVESFSLTELTALHWRDVINLRKNILQVDQNTTVKSFAHDKMMLVLGTVLYLLNKLGVAAFHLDRYRPWRKTRKEQGQLWYQQSGLNSLWQGLLGEHQRKPGEWGKLFQVAKPKPIFSVDSGSRKLSITCRNDTTLSATPGVSRASERRLTSTSSNQSLQ